jgi:DNA gyrase/topoisomerase IV subunit B
MAETYKKHTHREHILELPDTYIGSIETSEESRWVFDPVEGKMVHRKLQFNPGFYKIFDEIVVNARDALVRSQQDASRIPVKRIDITAGKNNAGQFQVSVKNDGDGIPIQMHETEKCWIPELIFGHLLTSSNYDKTEEKIVGGKNGYGQKCLERNTLIPQWNGTVKIAGDITAGDKLIGDDGTPRVVKSVLYGTGQMYEVEQANADSYTVNDQHILTLYMPDHKVILWNETKNGWSVLWWNHEKKCINHKTISFKPTEIQCNECGTKLSGNIQRHYKRMHKDKEVPKKERKRPNFVAPDTPEVQKARAELEDFCKTIPDEAVFDMSIQDYMNLTETTKKRLAGVRGQCVQWPKQDVMLDPYILGLWLGDGMKGGRKYACYEEKDPELIQAFQDWGVLNDAVILKKDKYTYQISSKSRFGKKGSSPLRNLLKQYNLVDNKHIPVEYIVNDRETRLQVLAGLIDTDGHVSRNGTRVQISQGLEHKAIVTGILHLARSLGFCCQLTRGKTTWSWKDEKRMGEAYFINISGEHLGDIPTRLPRKKCANSVVRKTSTSTGFLTVKDAGIKDYVGISIDGNERFVINDFTVTHNCTNIYSDSFTLGIRDPKSSQKYEQVWRNNMSICEKPHITKDKASKGYVEVTYVPDLKRFHGLRLEEMLPVLHTRSIELAALAGKDVKVTWNGEEIKVDTFEKFVRLFLRADSEKCLAYERCSERWEVAAVLTRSLFSEDAGTPEDRHISFVNGINTRKGGKHVETVQRHVLSDICEVASKKKKMELKPGQIKESITLFVNATIVNPSFDSQTKETLTTPAAKFGSSVSISPKFVDSLVKAGILDEAQAILDAKNARETKKTDGAKKRTIYGLPKLEDALLAGTAKSSECTLILTEGDSAATSAIAGLKVVGRERWGVFPLKGKMLNVKDISRDKFNSNEELTAIKKILGLEQGKKYKDTSSLRYGRILIMSDQDVDGFHIRGLLMNLFHTEWPELMHIGFLCTLMTPLVKMTRGTETLSFYSEAELESWKERVGAEVAGRYKSKYYKGLGTSTPAEAREWFENISDIRYEWDDATDQTMNLAFSKKLADERKQWLSSYDPKRCIKPSMDAGGKKHVPYSRFVHDELIHFSNADNLRSLPHVMDGLKPSQRKILFGCFKRNLKSEIRVAQLAGYVSEHAAYHHGEASLNQTITSMGQIFVGANNINLLAPVGQFGSRLLGGKDAASPRYIHTHLEPIVDVLYRKEDAPILNHIEDDGDIVEPDTYYPVVPMLAINGSVGIGTGFSTDIPPHNPEEIVGLLKSRIAGGEPLVGKTLNPWWIGFKGSVEKKDDKQWITRAAYEWNDAASSVKITELPVGVWTKDYKAFLDTMMQGDGPDVKAEEKAEKKAAKKAKDDGSTVSDERKRKARSVLKGFEDLYNDVDINFVLYLDADYYKKARATPTDFEKLFRLTSSWKTTNMCCFDSKMNIVKYDTIGDILEYFYGQRLGVYEKRRQHQIAVLRDELEELEAKLAFVKGIVEGRLKILNEEDSIVLAGLKKLGLPPRSDREDPDTLGAYEYLLRMRIDKIKKSSVEGAVKDVEATKKKITDLEATTAKNIWSQELDEFLEAWKKMEGKMLQMLTASSRETGEKVVMKKKVVRKK